MLGREGERICDYILAPAMNGFVLWVLQNALKSGKKRLYFLARDGYFMYQSAKIYCERLSIPLECRYLYCSRYSIRLPLFHLDIEKSLDYICLSGIDVNMRKILGRAGLSEHEQREVLEELHVSDRAEESISYAQLEGIKKRLRMCGTFRKYLEIHSKEAMPGVKGYLKEQGLLEKVPSAIVDSGWVGSTQKFLNEMLTGMGRKNQIDGYYFGLYELPEDVRRGDYHSYFFSPERGLREKVYFSNCLFEAVFSAPHGTTLGYRKEGKTYVPVCGEIAPEQKVFIKKVGARIMRNTMQSADRLKDIAEFDSRAALREVRRSLCRFMGRPTKREAELYGRRLFSDDVLDEGQYEIAKTLSRKELRDNHVLYKVLKMTGIKKGTITESAWYEGSAVRYGRHVKFHLFQYRMYKYLLYIKKAVLWRIRHGK